MTRNDWLFCLVAAALFLMGTLWHLSLPGLQYDESLAAAPAVNFVLGTTNSEPMQINPSVIHIFGRPLPTMVMTYIGPVKTMLHIPIFAVLGVSVETLRLLPILVVLACFPLTYDLCSRLFNRKVARITIALIALDPSHVFYLTRDVGPAALQVFFKLLALWVFWKWWQESKLRWFSSGMFLLGLGVSHKVDFLWIIGGLAMAILAVRGRELWNRLSLKATFLGALSFCIGSLPILAFNVATGGHTFKPFFSTVLQSLTSSDGSLGENLWTRVLQVLQLLNGDYISMLFTGQHIENSVFFYFFPSMMILSIPGLFLFIRKRQSLPYAPVGISLWIFILTVLIATCFSPTQLSGHHLIALYPMLHVAIACTLASITTLVPFVQRFRLDMALVTLLFITNLVTVVSLNNSLEKTGGVGFWSDAIYDLNEYLYSRGETIAAMEWGFTNNLIVLSKGKVRISRVYKEFWEKGISAEVIKPFLSEKSRYLFHTPDFTEFQPAYDGLSEAAARSGYSVHEEKFFYQRDAQKVYSIYRLERKD